MVEKIDATEAEMTNIDKGICPCCHSSKVEYSIKETLIEFHCNNCGCDRKFERRRKYTRR